MGHIIKFINIDDLGSLQSIIAENIFNIALETPAT